MELDALSVAIDGPAGSGKSSVALRLAQQLGLTHVDTGAMYRALTCSALKDSLDLNDDLALTQRLEELDLRWKDGELFVQGAPVSSAIRGADVTAQVSKVSAHAGVRRQMQRLQRSVSWQCESGVVMEGRDIGTVVLPLAPCKIYLDASVEERARRRAEQEGRALDEVELREVAEDLARRDRLDSEREESPLRVSPDAHVVDTTALDLNQVVAKCAKIAEESRPREADRKAMDAIRFQHRHYHAFHIFLRGFLRIFFRVAIRGSGHEETTDGLIYACNHVSWWDPPVIGSSVGREVNFLAKKELFWGPLGWFISLLNAFPIERKGYDAAAFGRARSLLASGGNLLLFPEGTRRPVDRPGPVKRGLGILAIETGQPYLPCYVEGTPHLLLAPFGRARVRAWLGPPIRLHALDYLRQTLSDREIQERVSQLYLAQIQAFRHRASAEHD